MLGAISLALAAALVVATSGVVLNPVVLLKLGGRAAGERYPCEGGLCGCMSARGCWTTCSCHSLAQRLAWAEREGVPVPGYVEVAVAALSEPTEPACPLCVGHEDTDDGTPGPAPSGLPTLSPMGCRGIGLLVAFAGVVSSTVRPHQPVVVPTPTSLTPTPAPPPIAWLASDVPTPPPRPERA